MIEVDNETPEERHVKEAEPEAMRAMIAEGLAGPIIYGEESLERVRKRIKELAASRQVCLDDPNAC